MFENSIRDLLRFNARALYEEYTISNNPVDILSFDNIFIECHIAPGMIFKGKRSGIIHNFTMDVERGYKYIEKFSGGITWYMMESKDVISSNCFKLKNENNQLISFNGQNITFRLSNKEIYFIYLPKTLKKSRLNSNKHKPKIKEQFKKTKSNLPPNLQTFKQKLISGNGFNTYKGA